MKTDEHKGNAKSDPKDHKDAKEPWIPMELRDIGPLGEVLQGGGGKLSLMDVDMGDIRKPKGGG